MARLKQSLPGAPPAAGVGRRGIHGHLPYLLRQANAVTRLALDRALADLEMTLPQFSALQMIGAYQPLSSADLARLTWLTPQTVNTIVRNLETRAAIVRNQSDWPLPIVTTIEPMATWYPAEDYHQEYWNGEGQRNPYCLAVIPPKLAKLRKGYAERLKAS